MHIASINYHNVYNNGHTPYIKCQNHDIHVFDFVYITILYKTAVLQIDSI